jgi:hypothetical protein
MPPKLPREWLGRHSPAKIKSKSLIDVQANPDEFEKIKAMTNSITKTHAMIVEHILSKIQVQLSKNISANQVITRKSSNSSINRTDSEDSKMKVKRIVWKQNQDHSTIRFKRKYKNQNEISVRYNQSPGEESSTYTVDILAE